MQHHAFVIEADVEEGIEQALSWVQKGLGLETHLSTKLEAGGNPDVVVLRYGLFSVEEARRISEIAMQAPLRGDKKVIIIAATRTNFQAQNALLKLFEEPAPGLHLFLILPTLGGLLSTLRSRVHELKTDVGPPRSHIAEEARMFIEATREARTAIIKKLATGKDEDERRENRDKVIAIVNGIEVAAYRSKNSPARTALLEDIATLRGYLHDSSAPVKMILEHLSLVIPKNLL